MKGIPGEQGMKPGWNSGPYVGDSPRVDSRFKRTILQQTTVEE